MNILVTGTAGFIGSYLARKLIVEGYNVIGIDNFDKYYSRKAKEFNIDLIYLAAKKNPRHFKKTNITPIFKRLDKWESNNSHLVGIFKFIETDIRKSKKLKKLFQENKIDKIVHLAGMAGVPFSIKDPIKYTSVNLGGTVNLLNLAVKYKIQNFIFASSSSVYGSTSQVPFKEAQNVDNPISPYAATKRMGEIICYTFSYLYKLPITCLRFFTVYGPLQRPYGMAIQKFIKLIFQNKNIPIFGNGKMGRDFTYITDIVEGIIKALNKPQRYKIYNLGNSYPISINKLADLIIIKMEKGSKVYIDKPPTEVPITYADITRAKKELGYMPKVSINLGLKRQIEIFKIMPKWYQKLSEE